MGQLNKPEMARDFFAKNEETVKGNWTVPQYDRLE